MKNFERLQRKHEEHSREKDIALHDRLAQIYMQDPYTAQGELVKLAKEHPKVVQLLRMGDHEGANTEYQRALRESAGKIADRVEKRTFARDPRRAGTYRGTIDGATLLNTMLPQGPTETQRLMLRAQTLQTLGLQPDMSERNYQRAQIIDYLMGQNPGLSRPQAALLADRMLAQN